MFKYDLNEQMKNIRFGVCTLAVLKKERIIKKSKLSTAESLFLEEKKKEKKTSKYQRFNQEHRRNLKLRNSTFLSQRKVSYSAFDNRIAIIKIKPMSVA